VGQRVGLQDQHLHGVIRGETEEETRSWESFPLLQDGVKDEDRCGHSGDD